MTRAVKGASKAAQIRALHKQGHTTRVIAEIVLGLPSDASYKDADRIMAYVRAAARQRGTGSYCASKADRKYTAKPEAKAKKAARHRHRYHTDEEYRKRHFAYYHRFYWERGGREWYANYKRQRRAEAARP